jgi:TolA-binding protein
VPRQYAKSDFADEAIKRSSNIAKLIRLRESEDSDDPDAKAAREFSMAEIELFQFNDTKKALAGYQKLLDEFPDSELAPRAAYAIGYIHGIVLGDSLGALEWYTFLKRRYPDSQQAQLAYQFYPPARDTSEIPPGLPEEGAQ